MRKYFGYVGDARIMVQNSLFQTAGQEQCDHRVKRMAELEGLHMKVRWKGKTNFLVLTKDKVYTVLSIEKEWYRIIDDSGEDYLYPPEKFEIVEGSEEDLRKENKIF